MSLGFLFFLLRSVCAPFNPSCSPGLPCTAPWGGDRLGWRPQSPSSGITAALNTRPHTFGICISFPSTSLSGPSPSSAPGICPTVWILVPQNLPVPIPFPLLATTDVFLDMSFNLPEFCCWYSDFISTQHHVFETCACCSIHRNVIVSAHGIGFLEYVSTLLTCPHPWEGHSCNTDYTVPMRPSYMLPRDLLEQL